MGSFSRYSSTREIDFFGAPPPEEWSESVCSTTSTPGIDDLLRVESAEASNDDGLRSVLLAKAVEYEIIPRLMLAHRVERDAKAHPISSGMHVSPEDVVPFSDLVCRF